MKVIRVKFSADWYLYFFRKDNEVWMLERYETRCSLYQQERYTDLSAVIKYFSVLDDTHIDAYNGKSYISDDFWTSLLKARIGTDEGS